MSRSRVAYGGRVAEILGVAWSLVGITTIVIALRLCARCLVNKNHNPPRLSWPLGWAVFAWAVGVLGTTFLSVASHYGYGNHVWVVNTQGDLQRLFLYTWIWGLLSSLMVVAARLSVAVFYADLNRVMHKYHKWFLMSSIWASLIFNFVTELLQWFQCEPPRKTFDATALGTCPYKEVAYRFAVFTWSWGAFVDLCLACYPVYLLSRLATSRSLKVGIGLLVALGVFTAVCSIMKACELRVVWQSEDRTYDSTPLALWTVAECWLILIASGMPEVGPFVRHEIENISYGRRRTQLFNSVGNDSHDGIQKRSSQASTLNDDEAQDVEEGKISVMREVTVKRYERHNWEPRLEPSGMKTWGGKF